VPQLGSRVRLRRFDVLPDWNKANLKKELFLF
jgi:hypothetical protein